jgi:hypothetical protein
LLDLQLFATTDESDSNDTVEERYGIDDKGEFVIIRGDEYIYPNHSDNLDEDEEDDDTEDDEDDDKKEDIKEEDEDTEEDEDEDSEDEEDEEVDDSKQKSTKDDDDPEIEITVQGKKEKVRLSELRKGYMRQADYTKKTQKHAEDVKAWEASKKIVEHTSKQETQQQELDPATLYDSITEKAKEAVAKELIEEFDEFNPKHMAALSIKTTQIMDVVKEERSRVMQQNHMAKVVEDWETDTRGKEPEHFDAIYDWAKENIKDVLTQREFEKAQVAFNTGDKDEMDKYFDKIATAYFKAHNIERKSKEPTKKEPKKIEKKKPPVGLEKSGQGNYEPKKKVAPASKLGGMSSDAQTQWLIDMGIV